MYNLIIDRALCTVYMFECIEKKYIFIITCLNIVLNKFEYVFRQEQWTKSKRVSYSSNTRSG